MTQRNLPLSPWCVSKESSHSEGKASAYNAGDLGSIPGSGRSPGEGNGNPLQYSCLENPMDGGTWLGYSPLGRKESDMTERLHSLTHSHWAFKEPSKGPQSKNQNLPFLFVKYGNCHQYGHRLYCQVF